MDPVEAVIAEIKGVYSHWGRDTSIDKMRADWDNLFRHRAEAMEPATFDASGVPAAWVAMPEAQEDRIIFYLHGGGFRLGSLTSHLDLMQRLSAAAAARVLFVRYRRMPEHSFPAPLDDALRAYRWLVETSAGRSKIAVAGDSAGGGLAASMMLAARAAGLAPPCAAYLMSPWTDMEAKGASFQTRAAADPIHSRKMILALAKAYLGNHDPRDPRASPIHADLSGLPPILIQCGGRETVLDDSTALADRARACGVEVNLQIYEPMIHVFQMFADALPEARQAIREACEFIQQRFLHS